MQVPQDEWIVIGLGIVVAVFAVVALYAVWRRRRGRSTEDTKLELMWDPASGGWCAVDDDGRARVGPYKSLDDCVRGMVAAGYSQPMAEAPVPEPAPVIAETADLATPKPKALLVARR